MSQLNIHKTGNDWTITTKLTLKSDGAAFPLTGATITAAIASQRGNSPKVLLDNITVSEATTGADWANGLVVVKVPKEDTATIEEYEDIYLYIKVTLNGDDVDYKGSLSVEAGLPL